MTKTTVKIGIVGLGRGFSVMLPSLALHPRIDVVAAADPRGEARALFEADFGGVAYDSMDEMCASSDFDAVYIATPHQLHARHTITAAQAGKHILVEKPMALTLKDCGDMIDAAMAAGVKLLVGHSHSYDAPIAETRRIIDSGAYGSLQLITGLNYTDFLYRPRRPDELDSESGGGVVFSQAAHQIDIARLLGGGLIETVYATTGNYDNARSTEGAYTAILKFASGAVANLTFSGYGHFDSDEFCGWRGETGFLKDPARYGAARRTLQTLDAPNDEVAMKVDRAYGGSASERRSTGLPEGLSHEHFGLFVVSCSHGDIRPFPDRVRIYGDDEITENVLVPPTVPRAEVMDELCAAVLDGIVPVHSGEWGRATLEASLAILQSARKGKEIRMNHQVTG